MDSRTLINRLRTLADNVDQDEEVEGTGAFFGSDGPFLRELADALEEADEGRLAYKGGTPRKMVEAIAGRITRA